MQRPRIFLGSSGQQAKLLSALERGLEHAAEVVPWTSSFNPGTTTLERLIELTREVDYAVFVFAQDDWTSRLTADDAPAQGQASPRDNVIFEAGLFGGVLGMRRTIILHAKGSKLPTDLLGLTCVRYDSTTPAELKRICDKICKAVRMETERASGIEGDWWQLSLTARTAYEPSAISLLRVSREAGGTLSIRGSSWREDGALSARYWSEASRERENPSGIFYYWNGERPLDPESPRLEGTGEIKLESADRAAGYWITRTDKDPALSMKTSGVYLRAASGDHEVLHGRDDNLRRSLIALRLAEWKSLSSV